MSRIQVLPEHIFNKIAAGEVIERPASVVKELVENSIDAGATKISVCIEKAGMKMISVSDNGSGMDADDAILCLEPHATSKIKTEADIHGILSFGFRGEALPSIGSVSRLTLRTRERTSQEGFEIVVNGGKHLSASPAGCAPGTEIIIRELFFNTPARKKFMRSDITEEKHIQETLMMLALPYPDITFELVMDGKIIFCSPAASDLRQRIGAFFGKEMSSNLMPLMHEESSIKVSGFVARHGFTRTSRKEQKVFINRRPVEAFPVYKALRDAYSSLVEKGRFPPAIVFLDLDPQLVDVNVHPAKREVRFRSEYSISDAVLHAVQKALRDSPLARQETARASMQNPELFRQDASSVSSPLSGVLKSAEIAYSLKNPVSSFDLSPSEIDGLAQKPKPLPLPDGVFTGRDFFKSTQADQQSIKFGNNESLPGASDEIPAQAAEVSERNPSRREFPALKVIGVIENAYIAALSPDGLMIIDQHAAHERILFEKITRKEAAISGLSQKLLIPVTLDLSRIETLFIEKNQDVFLAAGFEIEPFGNNTVLLRSLPAALEQDNAAGLVRDMLSILSDEGSLSGTAPGSLEKIATAACKAAVKAHDKLSTREIESLIEQMKQCEIPFSCPHGRPTVINITVKELERRFGRR